MRLKPLFDRVILLPEKSKQQTQSGIVLPPTSEDKSSIATVVAIGDGIVEGGEVQDMVVGVGQKVLFTKYAGSPIKIDDINYIVIKQTDLLAIIEE